MTISLFVRFFPLLFLFTNAKKKCPGHFSGKVANLCESHFPDANSEKVWLIKFYAPWCGHCNAMKDAWSQLAKELSNDKDIGIGAVDCDVESNKPLCGKYGVQGFPTIKAIVNGKAKSYNGAREKEPLKEYILGLKAKRGSKGGSAKCQKGLFSSNVKDSVLPLCDKHYPDEKSKNSWVVAFYNKDSMHMRNEFNRLALEFGNNPPDQSKQKKIVKKQSERFTEMKEKYSIKGQQGTRKAGKSKDGLAKFGGVCCDCDKEEQKKCKGKKLPAFSVFNDVKKKTFEYDQKGDKFNFDDFAGFVMQKLDLITSVSGKEEL